MTDQDLIGWWVSVRGRAVGKRIKVYGYTDDGKVVKYYTTYNGNTKPFRMTASAVLRNYEREKDK